MIPVFSDVAMRRLWKSFSEAIDFITNDDLEEPEYLLFPGAIPHTVNQRDNGFSSSSLAKSRARGKVTPDPPLRSRTTELKEMDFSITTFTVQIRALQKFEGVLRALEGDKEIAVEKDCLNALRCIAEILVWADKNNPSIWESFMEHSGMHLLVRCLEASRNVLNKSTNSELSTVRRYSVLRLQSAILQTLAIVVQSVSSQQSLLHLFTANHINNFIEFEFELQNDEILGYYVSALKSIAAKVDSSMLQLFFDPTQNRFPLLTSAVRFLTHRDSMVRTAARNIILKICASSDAEAVQFALRTPDSFLEVILAYLVRLCGSAARATELIMDDGVEVPRNRHRTGLLRKKVRHSDVSVRLSEIENIVLYLSDLDALRSAEVGKELRRLLSLRLIAPLFYPLSSRASLSSEPRSSFRWSLRSGNDDQSANCLAPFDAAARVLILTFIVHHLRDSPLTLHIVSEIARPIKTFQSRSVLNALKAMIGDISGTERISYCALRALEVIVSSPVVSARHLSIVQLNFESSASSTDAHSADSLLSTSKMKSFVESLPDDEPVLMTLTDFEAPLTPCVSLPSTPKLEDNSASSQARSDGTGASTRSSEHNLLQHRFSVAVDEIDEEAVLRSFRSGEASLRDTLSAVLLVSRRTEARSVRVIQTVARIIECIGRKTSSWVSASEVIVAVLEVLATSLTEHCRDSRTTPSMLSSSMANFQVVFSEDLELENESEVLFTCRTLPTSISQKPEPFGKSRGAVIDDSSSSVALEDALVMLIMVRTYEHLNRNDHEGTGLNFLQRIREIISNEKQMCSVKDKRQTLARIAQMVVKQIKT